MRMPVLICAVSFAFLAGLTHVAVGQSPEIVHEDVRRTLANAPLSMIFEGKTPAEFLEWRRQFGQKLNELLGHSTPPKEWEVTEESKTQLDDHLRLELLLHAENIPVLPVYLLIPNDFREGGKTAGVLCVHGHGDFGNDTVAGRSDLPGVAAAVRSSNYDYGLQFVRRGYVVVAPCMIPFGRRVNRKAYGGNDPCAVNFVRMQAVGQLPITANLRDLRWCIDLLQQRPEVNGDRIGCAGLSYGGRMTMLVSAIDERIKVAAVSGALNLMQERMSLRHSCGSQMIPGLLNYGDYSEIGSLIAPRPCVWETGSKDGLIVKTWDEVFRSRLSKAYSAAGAADNLHFDRFEGGHRWNGDVAFPLFERVLHN